MRVGWMKEWMGRAKFITWVQEEEQCDDVEARRKWDHLVTTLGDKDKKGDGCNLKIHILTKYYTCGERKVRPKAFAIVIKSREVD